MEDTARRTVGKLWAEEVHHLLHDGFFRIGHLYPDLLGNLDAALNMHYVCLLKLVEKRVESLASAYLRPPHRYAGALSQESLGEGQEQGPICS